MYVHVSCVCGFVYVHKAANTTDMYMQFMYIHIHKAANTTDMYICTYTYTKPLTQLTCIYVHTHTQSR